MARGCSARAGKGAGQRELLQGERAEGLRPWYVVLCDVTLLKPSGAALLLTVNALVAVGVTRAVAEQLCCSAQLLAEFQRFLSHMAAGRGFQW